MDLCLFGFGLFGSIQIIYDRGSIPDNLSILHLIILIGLTIFIAYFIEKRRCLYFVKRLTFASPDSTDWRKLMYSIIVLVEKADSQFVKDQIQIVLIKLLYVQKMIGSLGDRSDDLIQKLLMPSRVIPNRATIDQDDPLQ